MGNTRFVTLAQNAACRATAALTNPKLANGAGGVYAGAPALVEDPSYPMANILGRDRYSVWACPAGADNSGGGGEVWVDLDLGSNRTVLAVGILGFRAVGSFPSSMLPSWRNAGSYSATGYTTDIPAINLGTRNPVSVLPAPRTARYWRFAFPFASFGDGFRVGKFFLATTITDLGFLYSGAEYPRVTPRVLSQSGGQHPNVKVTGDPYDMPTLQFTNVAQSTKDTLSTLASQSQPFVLIDPFDRARECILASDRHVSSHIWAPPDRWSVSLELREMG